MDVDFQVTNKQTYLKIRPVGMVSNIEEYKDLQFKYFEIISGHPSLKALIDTRKLSFPSKISDQVEIIRNNQENMDLTEARKFKIALLIDSRLREPGNFYESYSFALGINLQIFEMEEEAADFLKG